MDGLRVGLDKLDLKFKSVADQLGIPHEKLLNGGIALFLPLVTIILFKLIFSPTTKQGQSNANGGGKKNDHAAPVKSIWDFNRNNQTASTAKSKDGTSGKPFGSTYYYAHNNPNATGGYKDGLRMEDYTMNQPRLLSRDGKPVEGADAVEQPPNDTTQEPPRPVPKTKIIKSSKDADVKLITKYQWDDPGDLNGIAHIRIDTLPGKDGADIKWQDIQFKDVSAKLVDKDGLEVKVQAETGETYLLKVPALYGQASAVRAYVKPKRLVVRLWKVKSMLTVLDYGTSNLKPWPQLRKQ